MKIKQAISPDEKKQLYNVRTKVFIDEQNVPPEVEMDEHENDSIHFIGYENGKPIAASRLRFVDGHGKLERICVLKEHRGKSFGKQMIRHMEKSIAEHGFAKAKLNAQTHAENFYQRLGYKAVSGAFMDAGIPHVTMVKQVANN